MSSEEAGGVCRVLMIEIVIATTNQGKLGEISSALSGLPVSLLSLEDFAGAPEVVEDGKTFRENASQKARAIAGYAKKWALADDSGLVVDALDGAPGVFSARFAGAGADDAANNDKLIAELSGVPAERRTARFLCVMALCAPGGVPVFAEGACEGLILFEPRGRDGFGYDPLFYYPPLGRTFAEIVGADKNLVSHRGLALFALRERIIELGGGS